MSNLPITTAAELKRLHSLHIKCGRTMVLPATLRGDRPLASRSTFADAFGSPTLVGIDLDALPRRRDLARFPHARGDRPRPVFPSPGCSKVPPRSWGSTLLPFLSLGFGDGSPHARGDRPIISLLAYCISLVPPRSWGSTSSMTFS